MGLSPNQATDPKKDTCLQGPVYVTGTPLSGPVYAIQGKPCKITERDYGATLNPKLFKLLPRNFGRTPTGAIKCSAAQASVEAVGSS